MSPLVRTAGAKALPRTMEVATRLAFGEELVRLGGLNKRLVVLDGDLGNSTRTDMFADAFPHRFLQMGIGEQNMAGVAAGLAAGGLTPVMVTFAAFAANRDLDQIRVSIAQPNLHVIIVGAYSGLLVGRAGKTHISLEDIAIFRVMPNMTVLAPGDAVETRRAVQAAVRCSGPVYIRLTRDPSPVLFTDSYRFRIGKAVVLRRGRDVALLSTGVQTARVLEAADLLAQQGIGTYVLHLPTIKPLDAVAVIAAARRTRAVVTAEDHTIIGGLGAAVAEVLSEEYPCLLRRVGIPDVYAESGSDDDLLEKYGLTGRCVAAAAFEVISARENHS